MSEKCALQQQFNKGLLAGGIVCTQDSAAGGKTNSNKLGNMRRNNKKNIQCYYNQQVTTLYILIFITFVILRAICLNKKIKQNVV